MYVCMYVCMYVHMDTYIAYSIIMDLPLVMHSCILEPILNYQINFKQQLIMNLVKNQLYS